MAQSGEKMFAALGGGNWLALRRSGQYTALMVADDLRAAVRKSKLTAHAIAKTSGLAKNTVARFLAGAPCSIDNAELIAHAIGATMTVSGKLRKNK